jgi:hypothetical protein
MEDEGHISRPPTKAEIVYLHKGMEVMGFPAALCGHFPG